MAKAAVITDTTMMINSTICILALLWKHKWKKCCQVFLKVSLGRKLRWWLIQFGCNHRKTLFQSKAIEMWKICVNQRFAIYHVEGENAQTKSNGGNEARQLGWKRMLLYLKCSKSQMLKRASTMCKISSRSAQLLYLWRMIFHAKKLSYEKRLIAVIVTDGLRKEEMGTSTYF